jgi:hypothetical protein
MASKSFGTQAASVPHLSKGELADLRSDVEAGFAKNEARTGFPTINKVNAKSVSIAGVNVDFALVGADFGTVGGDVSATLGGSALTVQVAPAGTTVTLRLAAGSVFTGFTGHSVALHMSVKGVDCLPMQLEVVA